MSQDERDLVQLPLTQAASKQHGYLLVEAADIPRQAADVVVGPWFKDAVASLNPDLGPKQIAEALTKLEAVLSSTTTDNLVSNAKQFLGMLRTGVQVRVNDRLRSVRVVDFDNPEANHWAVSTEVRYQATRGYKAARFDIVHWCNGIPFVVTETKTTTDVSVSWLDAALDLANGYTNSAPAFLAAGLLQIATDGREVHYGGVKTPAQRFAKWGTTLEDRPRDNTWEQVEYDYLALTDPRRLLDWARDYILHMADKSTKVLTRFVPRWTQAEAAPLVVARSLDPAKNRGLLAHFQGSGKTLAMLMAANAITRIDPKHCVVLVVDRLGLLEQHKNEFNSSDARVTTYEAETAADLARVLRSPGASGIVITTVHRFSDTGLLTERTDITVLVDEAHRSQEGLLGQQMRTSLPNANLIGLTGTPIVSADHNTFEAFGCEDDPGQVMHRYNAADSVHDGTTVPLMIDRRPIVQALDKEQLDQAYEAYLAAQEKEVSAEDAEYLARALTSYDKLLADPRRIDALVEDIFLDASYNILPGGYGIMVVVANRALCVEYVTQLRKVFSPEQVTSVISGNRKDDPESFAEFIRDSASEETLLADFRDPTKPLKVLVVTSKLLTGFDARNCRAIYVDKPMKGHTLFQAVTRVNRTYTTPAGVEKGFGIVVDYCGVANEILDAFNQSTEPGKRVEVATPGELVTMYKKSLERAEACLGADFDWKAPNFVHAGKAEVTKDAKLWRAFRRNVNRAELIMEVLPQNSHIQAERYRLRRLLKIHDSVGDSADTRKRALLLEHGPAVQALMREYTGAPQATEVEAVLLDEEVMRDLIGDPSDPSVSLVRMQSGEIKKSIADKLAARMRGPHEFEYRSLAEKLEEFSATVYLPSADGARQAALDLVTLVRHIKEVDERLGDNWDDFDEYSVTGPRPEPVLDETRVLSSILDEFAPKPMPVGLPEVAGMLDGIVDRLSYKRLKDDVAAQKELRRAILMDCKRQGILPADKEEKTAFLDRLIDYVNFYLA